MPRGPLFLRWRKYSRNPALPISAPQRTPWRVGNRSLGPWTVLRPPPLHPPGKPVTLRCGLEDGDKQGPQDWVLTRAHTYREPPTQFISLELAVLVPHSSQGEPHSQIAAWTSPKSLCVRAPSFRCGTRSRSMHFRLGAHGHPAFRPFLCWAISSPGVLERRLSTDICMYS